MEEEGEAELVEDDDVDDDDEMNDDIVEVKIDGKLERVDRIGDILSYPC